MAGKDDWEFGLTRSEMAVLKSAVSDLSRSLDEANRRLVRLNQKIAKFRVSAGSSKTGARRRRSPGPKTNA